jgi:phosphonate transport system substrate-binding protein
LRRSVLAAAALLLTLLSPNPAAQETAGSNDPEPRRFGVVSFYSPRMMYLKYQPLVDYLSEQTGRGWELHINTTYQQTVDDLCSGRLTAAYLGPLTYVRAHAACGAEPVLRLQTGGRNAFYSYILVREDSEARVLADLSGARFGFGSVLSTSSHLVPRAMLIEAGLDLGEDIECSYLEHHDRAARAVLLREVDACGVRDIVGDRFVGRGLRILARSEPIPNFPIVSSPQAPAELRSRMVRALVELPKLDPAIAEAMLGWDEELARGFVPTDDAEYDGIRALAASVFGEDALTVPEGQLRCAGSGP